jgi:hypothetical protein
MFHAMKNGKPVYGETVKEILEQGIKPVLDKVAVKEIAENMFPIGDRTIFEGIRRVPTEGRYRLFPKIEDSSEGSVCAGLWKMLKDGTTTPNVLLSGGIDSTLIAAAAKERFSRANTFTFCFKENMTDAQRAKDAAATIGCRNTLKTSTLDSALDGFDDYLKKLETIPVRPSFITHHMIGKWLRGMGIKAIADGEYGDELFGGYPYNFEGKMMEGHFKKHPPMRMNAHEIAYHHIKYSASKVHFYAVRTLYEGHAVSPFATREMENFALSLPAWMITNKEILRTLLNSKMPGYKIKTKSALGLSDAVYYRAVIDRYGDELKDRKWFSGQPSVSMMKAKRAVIARLPKMDSRLDVLYLNKLHFILCVQKLVELYSMEVPR